MSAKSKLLNLFDRPLEPAFMPKGANDEVFVVPEEYLADRYKPLKNNLEQRFGSDDNKIFVKQIRLPDFRLITKLGRRENFSIFIPFHRKLASRLIEIFLGMRNVDDFLSVAVYIRDRANPFLFMYAYSVAILHRPDTKDLNIPPINEIFPEKFVDGQLFARAQEETNIVKDETARIPISIPKDYTGSDLETEHRVAYFREDMGINLHHWHWHLVYPFSDTLEIVNKDRRGELFYFMHQQIIARYNFERLCNNIGRVVRFTDWRSPIPEGYFPKMDSLVSSRNWPARMNGTSLTDIRRETDQLEFDIQDLERWRDRIFAAIHTGAVVDNQGRSIPLTESRGIDLLGNILEASILSVNQNLYGDLHNLGHVAIALSHDPDHRHLETFAVMGDSATAMRDPIFYRWHSFINDIFSEHKNTLPRYTTQQLDYPGVRVTGLEVVTDDKQLGYTGRNTLFTFWQQSDLDFSRGLDFSPRGSVFARITHLQHSPYVYRIQVDSQNEGTGTVRIFLAPKFDERGLPMLLRDQKHLFIEMDRFTQKLAKGRQVITRNSTQSNLTIPFERTFRNLDANRPADGTAEQDQFNFCGCGWPHHMLVPKGNAAGYPCQLFVMITNFKDDMVEGSDLSKPCSDASVFCGLRDTKYPDKRSMGFPFDRQPRDGVENLVQFLTPNMGIVDVAIRFNDRTVAPPQLPGRRS